MLFTLATQNKPAAPNAQIEAVLNFQRSDFKDSNALQFLIQFVIRDAPDLDAVIDRFTQQLIHRGFSPLQFRVKNDNGSWGTWSHIEAA